MVSLKFTLATRMTRCAVGGIRSHSRISLSTSLCAATTGQRDYVFRIRIAVLIKTLVIPELSCGATDRGVKKGVR